MKPNQGQSPENPIAAAFDSVSARYDRDMEGSPATRHIRETVYGIIQACLPEGGKVIDINCGTGTDAVELRRRGFEVCGIDVSGGMIAQAMKKAEEAGAGEVRFECAGFEKLSHCVEGPFDLVLSNFGGLNCAGELHRVAAEIDAIVHPGSFVLVVAMSPFSVWETVAGLKSLNIRRAFRRMSSPAPADSFQGHIFPVWYYWPRDIRRAFPGTYRQELLRSFHLISPPPRTGDTDRMDGTLSRMLAEADSFFGTLPPFRSFGDHYLSLLRKV